MIAFEEDFLLEARREAVEAAGDPVHAVAQSGQQGGIKKVSDDDKAIVLVSPSPLFRYVLHWAPPLSLAIEHHHPTMSSTP
jgi:hypothetical protein